MSTSKMESKSSFFFWHSFSKWTFNASSSVSFKPEMEKRKKMLNGVLIDIEFFNQCECRRDKWFNIWNFCVTIFSQNQSILEGQNVPGNYSYVPVECTSASHCCSLINDSTVLSYWGQKLQVYSSSRPGVLSNHRWTRSQRDGSSSERWSWTKASGSLPKTLT